MFSCFAPLVMAAALGQQAQDQSAWLKSVPADAVVVARTRSLETVRDDLLKMLEAMSGNAAALARPQLEQGLAMFEAQTNKQAVQSPFFVLMTLPKENPVPGWAVMVQSDKYEEILQGVAHNPDLKLTKKDGVDSFDGPDGQPWYGSKGTGFVTFGPDQALVKSVGKPAASLDEKLGKGLKSTFLGGDLAVYVNVAAVQSQYAEQIEQGKQAFLAQMDQAPGMNDAQRQGVKAGYARLFDSLKSANGLVLQFDFDPSALNLTGALTVKGDSDAAKRLAASEPGSGELLGTLPPGGVAYSYMKMSADSLKRMSNLSMTFMGGGGGSSPELQKALDAQAQAGGMEAYQAFLGTSGGMATASSVGLTISKDPAKTVQAAEGVMRAMKGSNPMYKDVTITPKAQTYKGFTFDQVKISLDFEKLNAQQGPANAAEVSRKLMGGDTIQSWIGTDGKRVLTVAGKSFDEIKPRIDQVLSGSGGVGQTTAFQTVRGKLPKQANGLMILNAQGLVQFLSSIGGAVGGGKAPAIPADMPKGPAYLGGSLVGSSDGFQFRLIVPSDVGPVVEKGLVPMIQSMQGQKQ